MDCGLSSGRSVLRCLHLASRNWNSKVVVRPFGDSFCVTFVWVQPVGVSAGLPEIIVKLEFYFAGRPNRIFNVHCGHQPRLTQHALGPTRRSQSRFHHWTDAVERDCDSRRVPWRRIDKMPGVAWSFAATEMIFAPAASDKFNCCNARSLESSLRRASISSPTVGYVIAHVFAYSRRRRIGRSIASLGRDLEMMHTRWSHNPIPAPPFNCRLR